MWELSLPNRLSRAANVVDPEAIWAQREFVYRIARALVLRIDLAEDVTQEVLYRALKTKEEIRDLRPFLRTLTVRVGLNQLRKPSSNPLEEGWPGRPEPVDDRLQISLALSRLSPENRALLALFHAEGLSYAEIAAALDIPEGTVASRLSAARAAFRNHWETP